VSKVRAALLLLIGLGIARDGHAHEFWVQPGEFQIAPGSVLSLALQVGDGGRRQRSPIPLHRVTRFDAIGPNKEPLDIRASLAVTGKHAVVLDVPGTYVLALATDNRAYSRQSAERFNAYLETEGLTPALSSTGRVHSRCTWTASSATAARQNRSCSSARPARNRSGTSRSHWACRWKSFP
jgi:hypothetical protein